MPAKSKAQQRIMGMALAMQEGKMPMKGLAGEMAKAMSNEDLMDFATTKSKNLPGKVTHGKKKK